MDPRVLRLAEALAAILAPAPSISPDDMIPIREAARMAATSVRVLRSGIRARVLTAYGKQRDRAIRRGDLDAWIASRHAAPVSPSVAQAARVARRLRLVGGAR